MAINTQNLDFYKLDELTQDMAEQLYCPFKKGGCKGRYCAAWRVHNHIDKDGKTPGYCKLIDK